MCAVLCVVEPETCAVIGVGFAAEVADVDARRGVDGSAGRAGLVGAELEFAVAVPGAVDVGAVAIAEEVVVCVLLGLEAVAFAVFSGEGVAFSCCCF